MRRKLFCRYQESFFVKGIAWYILPDILVYYEAKNCALPVLIALGGSVAGLLAASEDAGLYWPYSLMIMGMNSNHTEDVIAGGIWGFFLSCTAFLTVFLLIANVLLTKRDVEA